MDISRRSPLDSLDSLDSDYETEGPQITSSIPFLPEPSSPATQQQPKYVILGLWPHARPEQIHYYIRGYESLYPKSKVLILRHATSPSSQHVDGVLNSLFSDGDEKLVAREAEQDTLIHLFGDDAAKQICSLLKAYQIRTSHRLGVKALILDSVPVVVAPTLRSLQRNPLLLFSFLYSALLAPFLHIWATLILWFSEPLSERARRDLHDFCETARKMYVFPGGDIMFVWSTNEDARGELEERKEFLVERRSVDRESSWTLNQERYWLGIEDAWEGR